MDSFIAMGFSKILPSGITVLQPAWNPADKYVNISLSSSNTVAQITSGRGSVRSVGKFTKKCYFEMFIDSSTSSGNVTSGGIANSSLALSGASTNNNSLMAWMPSGGLYNSALLLTLSGSSKQVGFAVDPVTRKIWVKRVDAASWAGGGDPASGTTPTYTFPGSDDLYACADPTVASVYIKETLLATGSYALSPPTGFVAGIE